MNIRFICSHHARQVVLVLAATPFYVGIAHAQASPANAPSTSSSPPAAMSREAPATYQSAFEGYKPYTEEKTVDWKQANDNVGKIGGWREYAREASQPETATEPAVTPATADPKADPKSGSAKP